MSKGNCLIDILFPAGKQLGKTKHLPLKMQLAGSPEFKEARSKRLPFQELPVKSES